MLCFGGVGRSVGGNADKVMVDDVRRRRPCRCDGEDSGREDTYAFFAQLNMIADVVFKRCCVYAGCAIACRQEIQAATTSFTLSRRNDR